MLELIAHNLAPIMFVGLFGQVNGQITDFGPFGVVIHAPAQGMRH